MPTTAQPRLNAMPRPLPMTELPGESRADKGPKHVGFEALSLGCGRRALERAMKLDKKR